jgi:hypothetical protein
MLKEQEQFQKHIQVLMYYKQEVKVMKYLKDNRLEFKSLMNVFFALPLFEISTAQRVLSFAMGCFIRSLITIGKVLFVRAAAV